MANIKTVNPYGKYDKQAKQYFHTERQRKDWMKANGMVDSPPTGSEKRRVRDAVDEINHERKKSGKKELTFKQIVGNSKGAKYERRYF